MVQERVDSFVWATSFGAFAVTKAQMIKTGYFLFVFSFALTQKKQKVKTANSFHAKTTAINPMRDPSRPPAGGLRDRSTIHPTRFITLFCSAKN
jgi:hypothetical protein